tara:strand:- start:242 stop:1897 length:1656 start_codon:yes stop_codon:yes gene_type:complete
MALTKATYSMIQGAVFNVLDFGATGDGVTNDQAACQAAINAAVAAGGGAVYFPAGTYSLVGVAGLDTTPNGLLIPDTNGDFSTNNGIMLFGDGIDSVLLAGNTEMCVVRNSRLYTTIRDLKIDGGPKTQVIGLGVIPESTTQTTELVSNSFMTIKDVTIENCRRGMMFQPGPTVAGSDSGCFYHAIENLTSNLNDEHVLMVGDVTGAGNRITRTMFKHCVFLRGNVGCNIYAATEVDFVSCYWELISQGTVPLATPAAFYYADTNPANINLIGGYIEACTRGVVASTSAIATQVLLTNFNQSVVPDSSVAFMNKVQQQSWNISKPNSTSLGYLSIDNSSFVALVADPLGANSKVAELWVNGAAKQQWVPGSATTFYHATSDLRMDANGNFYPVVDNIVSCGASGYRWSAVWAANGAIQTSDPRTKTDIKDSELGLEFINKLRPVSYKFKVGGNRVIEEKIVKEAEYDESGNLTRAKVTEKVIEPVAGKRTHYGLLTTNVKEAVGDYDFGGYIKTDIADPESEEALRYDEFIAPLIKAVQELSAKVAALEAK